MCIKEVVIVAEALHCAFREGRAQGRHAFHKGLVVRKEQILHSNDEFRQRTEQTGTQLQETAAAAQHMTSAVKAAEVRNLAQRSADAATENRHLVVQSAQKSDVGARQAEVAGEAMRDIVECVHCVDALLSDMSSTACEQRPGVGQLSGAVAEIDRMTQENARAVQQFAAAVPGAIERIDGQADP